MPARAVYQHSVVRKAIVINEPDRQVLICEPRPPGRRGPEGQAAAVDLRCRLIGIEHFFHGTAGDFAGRLRWWDLARYFPEPGKAHAAIPAACR